jgi:hypothetical protein
MQYLEDFDDLPWYTTKIIKDYKKEELFARYSLDTLAGLLVLKSESIGLDNIIQKKFDEALKIVPKEQLQNRIAEVRDLKFKPNYTLEA